MDSKAVTWDDYKRWLQLESFVPPELPAPALARLSTDSRSIKAGDWFVPLSGESFDGHRYVSQALAQGAAGFFYAAARGSEFSAAERKLGLAVKDPLEALQKAASGWRRQMPQLKLVALTGSAGKTTTKEMLARILRQSGPTLATEANFNNEIGVPKTLQLLRSDHRYAVLEFGARQTGNIAFLCKLATPDVTCLLNVGTAHVGIFGSVEKLLATKLEIFQYGASNSIQIANFDDPRIMTGAKATGKKTISFGTAPGADVQVESCHWLANASGMQVTLNVLGTRSCFEMGVAHAMFAVNAAAAAAMAVAAGAKVECVAAGLTGFSGAKGRYQIHQVRRLTVIDDTYNANPESLAAGLATVARSYQGKRIGLVLGDMLELGNDSHAQHRRLGLELIAPMRPTLLATIGEEARVFAEGARAGHYPPDQLRSYSSVLDLLADHVAFEDCCDVLYIKGSNGVKLAKLVEALTTTAARSP